MHFLRLNIYFLVGSLISCDGASSLKPEATFDYVSQYRLVNLTRVLGSDFKLLSATDTIPLHLTFNRTAGTNIFLSPSADTVLTVRAFRFRGLYYLVESFADSSCWVHAVRIGHGEVLRN